MTGAGQAGHFCTERAFQVFLLGLLAAETLLLRFSRSSGEASKLGLLCCLSKHKDRIVWIKPVFEPMHVDDAALTH